MVLAIGAAWAIHVPAALAAAESITVRLASGRSWTGVVDAQTDNEQLWLRTGTVSMIIRRPIDWNCVAGAEWRGIWLAADELQGRIDELASVAPNELVKTPARPRRVDVRSAASSPTSSPAPILQVRSNVSHPAVAQDVGSTSMGTTFVLLGLFCILCLSRATHSRPEQCSSASIDRRRRFEDRDASCGFAGLEHFDSEHSEGEECQDGILPQAHSPLIDSAQEGYLISRMANASRVDGARADSQQSWHAVTPADIDNMDGHELEWLICQMYQYSGIEARLTRRTGDMGVDIVAVQNGVRVAIQVKRQESPVSRRAVSDAVGGMRIYECDRAKVITNSYFTKDAKKLAAANDCELLDRDWLLWWIRDCQQDRGIAFSPPR